MSLPITIRLDLRAIAKLVVFATNLGFMATLHWLLRRSSSMTRMSLMLSRATCLCGTYARPMPTPVDISPVPSTLATRPGFCETTIPKILSRLTVSRKLWARQDWTRAARPIFQRQEHPCISRGIEGWTAAGHTVSRDASQLTPVALKLEINPTAAVSTKEMVSRLNNPDVQIIDARTPREFTGEDIRA